MSQRSLLRWAPACALTIAIFVMSHLPEGAMGLDASHMAAGADKLAHAVAYGVLAWLLLRALSGGHRLRSVLVALLVVMAIGGIIELTQPWAGRTCAWVDWLANVAGASLAIAFWLVGVKRFSGYSLGPAEEVADQDAARRP